MRKNELSILKKLNHTFKAPILQNLKQPMKLINYNHQMQKENENLRNKIFNCAMKMMKPTIKLLMRQLS
jgi:hypothetical protein